MYQDNCSVLSLKKVVAGLLDTIFFRKILVRKPATILILDPYQQLKTLMNQEQKIKEVFLSAPAYIVNGNPIKALFKFFIPLKRYMKTKQPKYIEQFMTNSFTQRDDFGLNYLSLVFTHFVMDFTPVPVIKSDEASKIRTLTTLIGADKDILFPGDKMIRRAKKIFPSLKKTLLVSESKHVQNAKDNKQIDELIMNSIPSSTSLISSRPQHSNCLARKGTKLKVQ